MSRGYYKGLLIGGLVGLAIGKMLRKKENSDNSRFLFSNNQSNHLNHSKDFDIEDDEEFDEEKYSHQFTQFHDEELGEDFSDEPIKSQAKVRRRKSGKIKEAKRRKVGSLLE